MKYSLIVVAIISLFGGGCNSPVQAPDANPTATNALVALTATAVATNTPVPTLTLTMVEPSAPATEPSVTPTSTATEEPEVQSAEQENLNLADVIAVKASGNAESYTFTVEISSPDTGCQQYADWWEVLSEDGQLLYRRILAHSHVSEQPFSRSGSPVKINVDTVVWVRAHMNPGGYGGQAFKGTVQVGFTAADLEPEFAAFVTKEPPLPGSCAF